MLESPPARFFDWLSMLQRLGRRCDHGGVLDGVEQLTSEVVHARPELAQAGGKLVVADDRRDGDDEACCGGDESFRDAGGDGSQGGCARGAEAVEGVDDAHDRAEEADEGSDGGDGREPGHVALHGGEGFAGCGLRGALESDGVAREAAASVLSLVLIVDLVEDGDEGAGLELIGDGGDLAQATRFAKGADETLALRVRFAEAGPLGEHDGPGEDAGKQQNDEHRKGYGAAVVNHLAQGACACCRRGGGVLLEEVKSKGEVPDHSCCDHLDSV